MLHVSQTLSCDQEDIFLYQFGWQRGLYSSLFFRDEFFVFKGKVIYYKGGIYVRY